jgi:hypothetical protein
MQGISDGQKTTPWHQVKSVGVNQGKITVIPEGMRPWNPIDVSWIPNAFVFLALVNTIMGQQQRKS